MCSIFPTVKNIDPNDNGTNAASKPKSNGQLVICAENKMAKMVPSTAAAPPNPAKEPTDGPLCKSLGIV